MQKKKRRNNNIFFNNKFNFSFIFFYFIFQQKINILCYVYFPPRGLILNIKINLFLLLALPPKKFPSLVYKFWRYNKSYIFIITFYSFQIFTIIPVENRVQKFFILEALSKSFYSFISFVLNFSVLAQSLTTKKDAFPQGN